MGNFRLLIVALAFIFNAGGVMADTVKTATFAGGCFWCMEGEFAELPGIIKVTSGYTGGHTQNPTYEEVSSGTTGHVEAINIQYDPAKISFEKLLSIFWDNVDPLDEYGQFCDKGSQYRAGIFYHDEEQKKLAEASKEQVARRFKQPVATVIREATAFYPAEDYHQEYYIKNRTRYKLYRMGCGRDARLDELRKAK